MTESLLSFSNVDLFGSVMDDLQIGDKNITWRVRLVSTESVKAEGLQRVGGKKAESGDFVLLLGQKNEVSSPEMESGNGIYRVTETGKWSYIPLNKGDIIKSGGSNENDDMNYRIWHYNEDGKFVEDKNFRKGGAKRRRGNNRLLEEQLGPNAHLARIYAFSYEGKLYDLDRPCIFVVHGKGDLVNIEESDPPGLPADSRAPRPTYLTGLAAAGFDFADGLRVWSYDKADYTIRMDVETGMFEDVLLNAVLGSGGDGLDARGMNARGMNARGMNARGMNARGGGGD